VPEPAYTVVPANVASRADLRIAQVPVAMRERTAGTPSQNAFRSSAYLLRVVTAVVLAVARRAPIMRPGSTVEVA